MWVLNNIETANEYTAANTLEGGPANRVSFDTYEKPIFYQLKVSPTGEAGAADWGKEVYLEPSSRTLGRRNVFGVRVRSAKEGEPGKKITLILIGVHE